MAKALETPMAPLAEMARQNMEMWAKMQASMLSAFTPAPAAPRTSLRKNRAAGQARQTRQAAARRQRPPPHLTVRGAARGGPCAFPLVSDRSNQHVDVRGKTIVVTGAGRGIGRAIAAAFRRQRRQSRPARHERSGREGNAGPVHAARRRGAQLHGQCRERGQRRRRARAGEREISAASMGWSTTPASCAMRCW